MEPWTLGSQNLRAGVPCLGLGDGGREGGRGQAGQHAAHGLCKGGMAAPKNCVSTGGQGVRKGPREPVSRHRAGGIDALAPRLPPPGLLQKRQEAPLPWTAAWEMRTSPLTITPLQQVRRDPPGTGATSEAGDPLGGSHIQDVDAEHPLPEALGSAPAVWDPRVPRPPAAPHAPRQRVSLPHPRGRCRRV